MQSNQSPPQTVAKREHEQNTDMALYKYIIHSFIGYEKIGINVIKACLLHILHVITEIFNNSLTSGCFPKDWKIAEVVSLTKDGDHEEPSTDRPISLLPVLSKVLERIAHNQFHNHNNDKLQQVQNFAGHLLRGKRKLIILPQRWNSLSCFPYMSFFTSGRLQWWLKSGIT